MLVTVRAPNIYCPHHCSCLGPVGSSTNEALLLICVALIKMAMPPFFSVQLNGQKIYLR